MATSAELRAQQNAIIAQANDLLAQSDVALNAGNLELGSKLHYQAGALIEKVKALDSQIAAADAAGSNTAADNVQDKTNAPAASQNTGKNSGGTPTTTEEKNNLKPSTTNTVQTSAKTTKSADDAAKANNPATTSVGGANATTIKTSPNPLHAFPSYTYGLTLHALDAAGYGKLLEDPTNPKWTATLISSASRYHTGRSEYFTDDFYFEDFKLTTLIGLNAHSKAGNAINMSFTLVEPYGMTLINRLLDLSDKVLGCQNYLEMPYVLEVNFFGYTDSGAMAKIDNQTKIFPIKIISMKIRAGVKGTEYQIEAVPYNHQANFYNNQSIKADFEVTAVTVGDYFNALEADTGTTQSAQSAYYAANPDAERKAKESATNPNDKSQIQKPNNAQPVTEIVVDQTGNPINSRTPDSTPGSGNATKTSAAPSIKTNSFSAANNAWNQAAKAAGNIEVEDIISFVIQDEGIPGIAAGAIKNAKVAIPKKVDISKTPSSSNDTAGATASARANDPNAVNASTQGDNTTKQVFSFNAGTTVMSAIDMVITNSEYITKQLVDPESGKAVATAVANVNDLSKALGNKPVNWFKVIPKLELKAFDKIRNTWGKTITYYIKPFTYYNTKDPRAAKSELPNPVKDYQYLYTGKNQDIIRFDMDFNALYFTALQVDKNAKLATVKDANASAIDPNTGTNSKGEQQTGGPTPVRQEIVVNDARASGGGAITKSESQNAQSFKDSIYSQLNGDMLQVNLEIIGDPDFIKQDDIVYAPDAKGYTPTQQYVNGTTGSLVMDAGELFCNLTFKTPADIDTATGGLRYYGNENKSAFSGMYRVLTVDSQFRQGKFTQTLTLVRQQNQPGDNKVVTGNTAPRTNPSISDVGINDPKNNSKVSGNSADKPSVVLPIDPAKTLKPGEEIVPTDGNGLGLKRSPFGTNPLQTSTTTTSADNALAKVADNGATAPIGGNQDANGTVQVGRAVPNASLQTAYESSKTALMVATENYNLNKTQATFTAMKQAELANEQAYNAYAQSLIS